MRLKKVGLPMVNKGKKGFLMKREVRENIGEEEKSIYFGEQEKKQITIGSWTGRRKMIRVVCLIPY